MGWKPEVQVAGNGDKWSQNALVFATEEEAKANARALMNRWFAVEDCRAVWVDDAVPNYRWDFEAYELVALEEWPGNWKPLNKENAE